VTAGTVFHRSKTPLTIWFRIAWRITGDKGGASALGVQRVIGLGSYQTAWTCLHKLRRAMVRPGRDRLRGTVEVDETLVGGVTPGVGGRSPTAKMLVAIAAEVRGAATGRIRLALIPDATKPVLHRFVAQAVEPGSVVRTDGWHSYAGIEAAGYAHDVVRLNGKPKDAGVAALPRVHRVASLLKRWLDGTHQGAVGAAHLTRYLEEFAFRFNRRTSRSRGLLFRRLLEHAVSTPPATYRRIVDPKGLG
jgi:transposase-like protein